MDDFSVGNLYESKSEWGCRLLTILTPFIQSGFKSIFEEAFLLCKNNDEVDKYLMTFQNLIARIPKWNPSIIEKERQRIIEESGCSYLEDLVTCVHIIQLKILSAVRVGQKQKKIDISIPKLDDFIHKIYINVARKVYKNVYLFEINIPPLQTQKNNRELEIIIQECILNAIRESIPIETILKVYMDETVEEDVFEETTKEEPIIVPDVVKEKDRVTEIIKEGQPLNAHVQGTKDSSFASPSSSASTSLSFNDIDFMRDINNKEESVAAPKTIERLEQISTLRNEQRKLESDDDDDDNVKLNINYGENVKLDNLDVNVLDDNLTLIPQLLIDDIEILE
jgi:hypothetical protein